MYPSSENYKTRLEAINGNFNLSKLRFFVKLLLTFNIFIDGKFDFTMAFRQVILLFDKKKSTNQGVSK
jgi:hypothetical protein